MTTPETKTKNYLVVYYWDEHLHHVQGDVTVRQTDELTDDISTWIRCWLARGEFFNQAPHCTRIEVYKRKLADPDSAALSIDRENHWEFLHAYEAAETFEEAQVRIYGKENLG